MKDDTITARARLREAASLHITDWERFIVEIQGHLREAADTIERLNKERDKAINGAMAMGCEVKRTNERFDRLGDYRAKAESDLRTVEQERDALKAEVEHLKRELETAREASDRVIDHLTGRIGDLQGQIDLWKDMTGKARIETALKDMAGR